jgi:hypothetical protein
MLIATSAGNRSLNGDTFWLRRSTGSDLIEAMRGFDWPITSMN